MSIDRKAIRESVTDTILATITTFPINVLLLSIADSFRFTVLQTAIFITLILFNLAVARKYFVRVYFKKRNNR